MNSSLAWKYALFVHTLVMHVEWSRSKTAANLLKHRVDFAEAADALDDMNALTVEDLGHDEQRFRSLVMAHTGVVLVVAFAMTAQGNIRLISARKASRTERRTYFEGR